MRTLTIHRARNGVSPRGRPTRRRIALGLLGAVGALTSPVVQSQATAAVTTSVHIEDSAYGEAGTIDVEGFKEIDPEVGASGKVPPGTCGIRWTDPGTWYWAPDTDDLLPNSTTHTGFTEITFRGPYPGCEVESLWAAPYWLPFPLTPDGAIPSLWATRFVVNVHSLADIEFLDKDGKPKPKPQPQGAICTKKDPCESKEQEITSPSNPTHGGPTDPRVTDDRPALASGRPTGGS